MDEINVYKGESEHPADIGYIKTNIPCQWACPALTDVPGYIQAIQEKDYEKADIINRNSNLFPSLLGRICTRPCESACRHGETDLGQPVSICHLKRLATDASPVTRSGIPKISKPTGKSVSIIGAGPAGMAAAHSLALLGHRITVLDMLPAPGGMMAYGIPAYRLPRNLIQRECEFLIQMGIQFQNNQVLGKTFHLRDLLETSDAVIIAAGCYQPRMLNVGGENLPGVFSGLDFMMKVNRGEKFPIGQRVMVIGGGFTAIDCARCARRLGADEVFICIRNVEEDLTVTSDEVHETKREGIRFLSLVSLLEIKGVEHVDSIRFIRNRFGGMRGASNRCIETIANSDFEMPVNSVIAAIGQSPLKTIVDSEMKLDVSFDRNTGESNIPKLYGAGDFVRGASTVIESIGHARQISATVDRYLTRQNRKEKKVIFEQTTDTHRKRSWDFIPKTPMPVIENDTRFQSLANEVETGYSSDEGQEEAKRCYLCNLKYEISIPRCIYCRLCIEVCPRNCIELVKKLDEKKAIPHDQIQITHQWNEVAAVVIDSDRCIRCGECLRVCPTQCIFVTRIRLTEFFKV